MNTVCWVDCVINDAWSAADVWPQRYTRVCVYVYVCV